MTMPKLTAVQKRAQRICADAIEHGADHVEWRPGTLAGQGAYVTLQRGNVSCHIMMMPRQKVYVASWCYNGDDARFSQRIMPMVNQYHGCKATTVAPDFECLRFELSRLFDLVTEGRATIAVKL